MFCHSVVGEAEFGTARIFYHSENGESAIQYKLSISVVILDYIIYYDCGIVITVNQLPVTTYHYDHNFTTKMKKYIILRNHE